MRTNSNFNTKNSDRNRAGGRLRRFTAAAVVGGVVAPLLGIGGAPAAGAAVLGNSPFSVIMCKYKDVTAEPKSPTYYREQFTTAGDATSTRDVPHYWSEVSYGKVNMTGTVVKGWYTLPTTKAATLATGRSGVITACVNAAKNAKVNPYKVPSNHRVIAVMNDSGDSGSAGGRVLTHVKRSMTFNLHEMGHSFGLGHSWSTDWAYQNADWSKPGEYDDTSDLMSALNVRTITTPYGAGGPGLNAFHLGRLGWLPANRVSTVVGADTPTSVSLTALNRPRNAGLMELRVPVDTKDPKQGYYSVELRHSSGWDGGLTTGVQFRIVRDGKSYLVRDTSYSNRRPMAHVDNGNLRIWVDKVDTAAGTAKVSVQRRSVFPLRCSPGGSLAAKYVELKGKHFIELTGVRMDTVGAATREPAAGKCSWSTRGGRGEELQARRLLVAVDDRYEVTTAKRIVDEYNTRRGTWTFHVFRTPLTATDPVGRGVVGEQVFFAPDTPFCCLL